MSLQSPLWRSPPFALDAEFREDQVKRDHGKFAKQAGSGAKQEAAPAQKQKQPEQPAQAAPKKANGGGTHPGHGYSTEAKVHNGVIHTTNVNDAVRALWEGRKVAMEQPHQVSTLVSKLGDIAKRAEKLGGKAPNFDLCNVSVEGTNLFCAETKGIPRVQMPQLPDEKGPAFQKFLMDKGYKAAEEEEKVSFLKATQSELVGAKVSGIMKFFRGRDPSEDPPLFVSRDNYIVDGHHRWAARVGLDAEKNMLGNVKVKIVRVDLPIIELLAEAETFTEGKGHKAATAHDKRPRWTVPPYVAADAGFKKKDLALDAALRGFLRDRMHLLAMAFDKKPFSEEDVNREGATGRFAEQASGGGGEAAEAPKAEEAPEPPGATKGRSTASGAASPSNESSAEGQSSGRPDQPAVQQRRAYSSPLAAISDPYARKSVRGSSGVRIRSDGATAKAVFEPSKEFTEALGRIGADSPTYHELAAGSGSKFSDHIIESKANGKFGAAVHVYSTDEYNDMRLFSTPDGSAGFALHGNDIISVYRKPGGPNAAVPSILGLALAQGGQRLDCFDTVLPALYASNGFRAVARLPFNDEYAPEGWDRETFKKYNEGRPDVVFMTYDPAYDGPYKQGDGDKIEEYDDGAEAQKQALGGAGLRGSDPDSHPATISSRRPAAVGAVERDRYRRIDQKSMEEEPENFKAITDLFKNPYAYINFRPGEFDGMSPHEVAEHAKAHFKDNLRFLYEHADEEVKKRGPQWYEGAHDMAADAAKAHGKSVQAAAGVFAALSPQKDWDQNVYLAKRLIEIHENHKDTAWDEAMTKRALVGDLPGEGKRKALYRIKHPEKGPTEEETAILAAVHNIVGKKYGELTEPQEKALWIRTYDEVHSDRHYDALNPDGTVIGPSLKKDGAPATAAWQSTPSLIKALAAWESGGNPGILSEAMGEKHKVRSFYNNILDPHSKNGDVTIDTHAVGAGFLLPLSGNTQAVMHNLDTTPQDEKIAPAKALGWKAAPKSNASGVTGTYGIWADAYRELAEELKIQPRVLQSVTWESKRRLMPDTMTATTKNAMHGAWSKYYLGEADLKETQNEVFRIANEGKAATAKAWAEAAAKKETVAAAKVARAKAAEAKAAEKAAKAAAKELKSGKPKGRSGGPVHAEDGYPHDPRRMDHAVMGQRSTGAVDSGTRTGATGRATGHESGRNRGQRSAVMWSIPRFNRPSLAMDRAGVAFRSEIGQPLAMDRAPSARRLSEDGHLHVINNRISKAAVNPYWGNEIPGYDRLGLDPERKYMLLRHPKELQKAAGTFANKPILAEHIPVSSDEHPSDLVIGSTGSDVRYEHPYLKSSLVFWPQAAIDAINSEGQKELSCAYHYDPVMTPGVYEGQRYDGIMTNIRGNHVALVKDGRAGSDVVVQDAMPFGMITWASPRFVTPPRMRR